MKTITNIFTVGGKVCTPLLTASLPQLSIAATIYYWIHFAYYKISMPYNKRLIFFFLLFLNPSLSLFPSTGSPGMLTPSFNTVHGLASPLATSFGNTPVSSMPLGFTLPGGSLAAGTLRLPGQMTGQTCVLLVSNLNEEVTDFFIYEWYYRII